MKNNNKQTTKRTHKYTTNNKKHITTQPNFCFLNQTKIHINNSKITNVKHKTVKKNY